MWVSKEMKILMQARNNQMDKENRCSQSDMQKLFKMDLKVRREGEINIIKLEGFWEFASTASVGAKYEDMDKNGKRDYSYFSKSPKFQILVDKISWLKLMSPRKTYKLINSIATYLGIKKKINKNYIDTAFEYSNTEFEEYSDPNRDLEENYPLTRIGKALSVILWDSFMIPISIKGKVVRSFGCYDRDTGVYVSYYEGDSLAPLAEINNASIYDT